MNLANLPTVNAILNSIAGVLLVVGYICSRQHREQAQRLWMLAAFGTSVLFLISYLVYHFNVGSVAFTGTGVIRPIYFTILISHIILAIVIVPMAIVTLIHGLRERFDKHRTIAKWTLPLWLYVSVTGVIVYVMLYQL